MDNELILFDRINIIKDTVKQYGEENFFLSFSGGKDSTVLHHLLDEAIPGNRIPRVFINTGLEYTDILKFVRKLSESDDRIVIHNAGVNVTNMLKEKGYPFKSKDHANKVNLYNQNKESRKAYLKRYLEGINIDGTRTTFACPEILKYQFSKDFNLKISDQCCFELKKKPAHRWARQNKKPITITGMRAEEGGQRTHVPCFSKSKMKFNPLIKVNEEWIDWYIKRNNIELCRLYYEPFNFTRTGCKGCPFSLSLSQKTWKQCNYCCQARENNVKLYGNRYTTNTVGSDTD